MKKRIRRRACAAVLFCTVLLGVLAAALSVSAQATADDGFYHGELDIKDVWTGNSWDGKYRSHRIPGIVVTKQDTVIIYCEARTGNNEYSLKSGDDWCLMDIFIQRSTDGGETFGDPIYIAQGNSTYATMNNPVMIVGNDNTLHMLYCKNYSIRGGGIWYRRSTDDGLTWSEERELSEFAESVPHDCFAFGPTHGISTRDGVLMAPVWLVPEGEGREGDTSHGPSKAYVFYSEDNGETWALSEAASGNSNETDIAQLSDGSIILNSRNTPRKITTSPNGIDGWTASYNDEQLPDPGCCGGLVAVDIDGLPYAHLFSNCASLTDRDHVTVKCSFDDCVTYEKSLMISEYAGGYSDIAVDSRGCVYVLYEIAYGNRMRLARFSFVDEFLEDDPRLTNQTTDFLFNSEQALSTVSNLNHLEAEIYEDALRLTSTDTRRHTLFLNLTGVTRNLNLTDYRAIAFEMRIQAQGDSNFVLGSYFQSGRIYGSYQEGFARVSVPNDGEWHTVVMELSPGIQGMLHGMRLELFSDTLRCEIGDTVDLRAVRFFSSVEDANEQLGLNDSQDVTGETAETTAPAGDGDKGCGSALPAFPLVILAVPAVVWSLKRGRKK